MRKFSNSLTPSQWGHLSCGGNLHGQIRGKSLRLSKPSDCSHTLLARIRRRHLMLVDRIDPPSSGPLFLHRFLIPYYQIYYRNMRLQRFNFLDLTISIREKYHSFGKFRKPTFTEMTIPNSSYHHPAHKSAAFSAIIHGLLIVPLPPREFRIEVNTIKYLASTNDFSSW